MGTSSQDFADLQKQVLDRRAELQRMWDYQQAQKPPTGAIAKDYPDLASRAWDFVHESYSWLFPQAQDDRGRKLLQELYVMYGRFQSGSIGLPAQPDTPPTAPGPTDPSHTELLSTENVFSDVKGLLILAAGAWVLSQWRQRS